jgi:hypothetical protein
MPATILAIADAVAAVLNGATFSQTFTAERVYVPIYELKEADGLKVFVVPRDLAPTILTRSSDDYTYNISIGILKRYGSGPMTLDDINAACDPLVMLSEEIVDVLRSDAAQEQIPASYFAITNAPVYDPKMHDEKKLFISLIVATYKKRRAR